MNRFARVIKTVREAYWIYETKKLVIAIYPGIKIWRRIRIEVCMMEVRIPSFTHIDSHLFMHVSDEQSIRQYR